MRWNANVPQRMQIDWIAVQIAGRYRGFSYKCPENGVSKLRF